MSETSEEVCTADWRECDVLPCTERINMAKRVTINNMIKRLNELKKGNGWLKSWRQIKL